MTNASENPKVSILDKAQSVVVKLTTLVGAITVLVTGIYALIHAVNPIPVHITIINATKESIEVEMDHNRQTETIKSNRAGFFVKANCLDAPTFQITIIEGDKTKSVPPIKLWPELMSACYKFDGNTLLWQP